MTKYAGKTIVPKETSVADIEKQLMRFGASSFASGVRCGSNGVTTAGVTFEKDGIAYRITMHLPSPDERQFTHTAAKDLVRSEPAARKEWEQATLSKWRALQLYTKGIVVAIEEEILRFEEVFLPHMIGPGGQTAAEVLVPQALEAAARGQLPSLDMFGRSNGQKALQSGE